MLNKREKLLFGAFATFVLIAIIPLNSSAQTKMNLNVSQQQTSNLTKYLQHVNVTDTPTPIDTQRTNFFPLTTSPDTNHILWITKSKMYEQISGPSAVVDGLVICSASTSHNWYNQTMLYAFDQNTGSLIWSIPGLSSGTVLDNNHMLCGTTMIDPNNGEILYKVPRSLGNYAEDIKMSFGTTSLGTNKGTAIQAYDMSDLKNPKLAWTTTQGWENTAGMVYDNGKVFFGGRNQYEVICADARTGQILWNTLVPDFVTGIIAGYGKIFTGGWTGGVCIDQNTGQILWKTPHHGRELSGQCLAYGKFYMGESNIGVFALDVNTGEIVWQYKKERATTDVFPAGGANQSNSFITWGYSLCAAGGKIFFNAQDHTAYGVVLPPYWKSLDGKMWNPHPYPVIAQCGTSEFVALDANYGSVAWKCGVEEVGAPGPDLDGYTVADGRVYGTINVYSGHVSMPSGTYSLYKSPWQFIDFEWYVPGCWCFGKGPTQFVNTAVSKSNINKGESVTISGKLVDLSKPIDSISICSNYTRKALSPASDVPVALSFVGASGGTSLANVNTDKDGKFSYTFYPSETGSIVIQSTGSDSYEAPDTAYTTVSVSGSSSLLTFAGFATFATIVAIAIPVIIYRRKPKA